MNLASWALVGGMAGIAAGIFFGDLCRILSPIGCIRRAPAGGGVSISDLLAALRSLEPAKAWRLFKCGWVFYLTAWVVTLGSPATLARAIPEAQMAVLGATPSRSQSVSDVLGLLIPTDLFTALSQNTVPAVVVFCIFYGVAIQGIENKAPLLSVLETIRLASLGSGTGSSASRRSRCSRSSP